MPSAPTKTPAAAKTTPKTAPRTSPAKAAGAIPAGARSAAARAARTAGEKPVKAEVSQPTAGATLRTRDLVARVAEASGGKVKDLRPMIEATLRALGAALDAGETLQLPPLGKLTVTPAKTEGATGPMKLKLRRPGTGPSEKGEDKEGLAEAGEDS